MDIFDYYREGYTEAEIEILAETSLRLGYMLNGMDYELFKNKCIAGEYKNRVQIIDGRRFDIKFFRLSPDVFLDWLQEYIFQRGEAFVTANGNTKPTENETSGKHIEILKVFADKATERESRPESKPPPDKYSIQAKELQKWIEAEFYKLLEENLDEFDLEGEGPKIPFLIIGGKKLIKSEYVKLRYEETHKKLIDHYYNKLDHEEMQQSGHYISPTDYIYEQIEKLINGKNAT